MFNRNTDVDWEIFGKTDPYFGVVTHDKYRKKNLSHENKEEFFRSGYLYIDNVLENIRQHIDPLYTSKRALDFGCGVGRLVVPLAGIAEEVTGVDVSDSMLEEARKNCEAQSIRNVHLVKSDDNLSSLREEYDLIHSYIVLQHIPVSRGERIIGKLIDRLQGGGVCVIHVTYAKNCEISRLGSVAKKYFPLGKNFISLFRGRGFFAPQMQMNSYNLNRLFFLIQKAGVRETYAEYTNHGGNLGATVYFKKPEAAR